MTEQARGTMVGMAAGLGAVLGGMGALMADLDALIVFGATIASGLLFAGLIGIGYTVLITNRREGT